MIDLTGAAAIATEYLRQLDGDGKMKLVLFEPATIEHEFGWVFFWGSSDPSILLAGDGPLIVDRKDGSVHQIGSAYPIERYLESYTRLGHPFGVPEHGVILDGWKPGLLKISLTKAIRSATGWGLAEAKRCTDEVLAGKSVTLTFPTADAADEFCLEVQNLGAVAERKTNYVR